MEKFKDLGIDVDVTEILSSSFAAASYLDKLPLPKDKKVYVIGHEGIGEELDLVGISHLGGPSHSNLKPVFAPGAGVDHDRDVGAVVVGTDYDFNYFKIQYAQLCLNTNPDCHFIATNLDAVGHATDAQEWAANGAMVGAIKGCTNREPVVVGKPTSFLIDHLVQEYGICPERMCMVGDRLDTDVLFGLNHGMQTILTLSGVTSKETLLQESNNTVPHYYVNSVKDF